MKHLQHCFGDYEKDFCEGDPSSKDIYESLPCRRRDICQAFQLYLDEVEKDRSEYFEVASGEDEDGEEFFYADVSDLEAFVSFCGKLVDRYETHVETIRKNRYKVVDKPRRRRKGRNNWKRQRDARLKRLKKERINFLGGLLEDFRSQLRVNLPSCYGITKQGVFPVPGELYIIDRTKQNRFGNISLRLKGSTKDVEILVLVPNYVRRQFWAVFRFKKEVIAPFLKKELMEFLKLEEVDDFL